MEPDQTIEILMQDLDPKIMEKFSKKNVANGKEATLVGLYFLSLIFFLTDIINNKKFRKLIIIHILCFCQVSGINKIIPSMKIDDFLFEPCGYSMNGILKNENIDFGLVSSN